MRERLTKALIDPATGLFEWWDRVDRLDVYQTGVGWPLITTIIDGFCTPAPWAQDFGKRKSETLFRVLVEASASWTAFYLKHQDDAWAVIDWVRELDAGMVRPAILNEFALNPAEEMGTSFLGLFSGQIEDMILFTYAPDYFFRISIFGRFKSIVPSLLDGRTVAEL